MPKLIGWVTIVLALSVPALLVLLSYWLLLVSGYVVLTALIVARTSPLPVDHVTPSAPIGAVVMPPPVLELELRSSALSCSIAALRSAS